MHYGSFYNASLYHIPVVRKNPQREELLLRYWRLGATGRETASRTGIPEGSVSRYFARFNKHPEKHNRLAVSGEPSPPKGLYSDIGGQLRAALEEVEVSRRHKELMTKGKIVQAKFSIEAEILLERYRSLKLGNVRSLLAKYMARPLRFEHFMSDVIREMRQQNVSPEELNKMEAQIKNAAESYTKGSFKFMFQSLYRDLVSRYERERPV